MLPHGRVPSLDPHRRVYSLTRIGGPLWGKAEIFAPFTTCRFSSESRDEVPSPLANSPAEARICNIQDDSTLRPRGLRDKLTVRPPVVRPSTALGAAR